MNIVPINTIMHVLAMEVTKMPQEKKSKVDLGKNPITVDVAASIDLETRGVMAGIGSHQQCGPYSTSTTGKNHFLDKFFDGLAYLYDHLNTNEGVEKVRSLGSQKML